MNLIDALNSINSTKKNLIRDSGAREAAEKMYPHFPVLRSLSFHKDIILLVNELNARGLSAHNISKIQHYEFLLNVIPKGKRFAKWEKSQKDEDIEIIMDIFKYSYSKAKEVLPLLSEKDIQELRSLKGGDR